MYRLRSISSRSFVSILLLLSACLFPEFATGQIKYSATADIAAIKSRKVIVITEKPNSAVLNRIGDNEFLEEKYDSILLAFNKRMKEAMGLWWPYNQEYEFKSIAEVRELQKKGIKDLVVVSFAVGLTEHYDSNSSGMVKNEIIYSGLVFKNDSYAFGLKLLNGERVHNARSYFCISLIERFEDKKPFFYCSYPSFIPLPGDFKFAMQYLESSLAFPTAKLLHAQMLHVDGLKLVKDTLVVNKDMANMTFADADKHYDFPIKFVGQDEFYAMFLEDSTRYAFVFSSIVGDRYHGIIMHSDNSLCFENKLAFINLERSVLRYMNAWVIKVIESND